GANLVKGATGQTIDNETLGGAMTHNAISGVAHYRTKDEQECLEKIRQLVSELPAPEVSRVSQSVPGAVATGDLSAPATQPQGTAKSSPPSEGGVAAASADGVVLYSRESPLYSLLPEDHKAP